VVHTSVQANPVCFVCDMVRVYVQAGCLPTGMHSTIQFVWEHTCVMLGCLVVVLNQPAACGHQALSSRGLPAPCHMPLHNSLWPPGGLVLWMAVTYFSQVCGAAYLSEPAL